MALSVMLAEARLHLPCRLRRGSLPLRVRSSASMACRGEISKMPFDKCSAAMSFQVGFKSVGFFSVFECYCVFDFPRFVFGCVRNITFIVFFKARFQIFGTANIKMSSSCFIHENINVIEVGHSFFLKLGVFGKDCREPGSICFADYAAAVFPSGFARQPICCATGLPRRNLGSAEMKTGGGYFYSSEYFSQVQNSC